MIHHRRHPAAFPVLFAILGIACGAETPASPQDSVPASPSSSPGDSTDDGATPPRAPGTCPDGEPFRLQSGKIVVPVNLDDGPAQSWVIDTGALTSYADVSIVDQVRNRDVKITVGGIETHITLGVLDVKASLRMNVVGVLGQDVIGQVLTIDYPRQRFFVDAKLDEARDADLRACEHVIGKPATVDALYDLFLYARGSVDRKEGWLLVDSGASLGATRESVFRSIDVAYPRPSLSGFHTPAAFGTWWARLSTLGEMEVGGHVVRHVPTRTITDKLLEAPRGVASDESLGVLPSPYLHHFMVTTDFVNKKLRLDPAKDDVLREPTMFFTVGIGLEERTDAPVVVAHVLDGSAAREQGILPGDEIVSINGVEAKAMSAYERAFALVSPKDGVTISIEIRRGDVVSTKTLVARDLLVSPKL